MAEQQSDNTTPQPQVPGQERGSGGRLTGQSEGEFDFDAFAAQSQQQGQEEPAAPPQPEPEAPQQPETPVEEPEKETPETASEQPEEEPQRPSDRFGSENDVRKGYDNLMKLQARHASELGELRRIAARYEAERAVRAEMGQQQPQNGQQGGGQANAPRDPRELAFRRAVQFQKERYGLDDEEAVTAAQEMIGLVDYVAQARIDQAAAHVRPIVEERRQAAELQDRVNRVALEADQQGQPVRPDWEEVTEGEEFAQVLQSEPDLIKSDLGLKHAYQTAKYMQMASPKRLAQEAEKLKQEARAVVEAEKAKAAPGTSNASPQAQQPTKEQAAFDSMFEVDTDRHWLMGGSSHKR